jgi:VCBS repeat-containing protein
MDGDTLTIIGHTNPMHGTLSLNANGSFTYTPAAGYAGNDSFTYTISDGIATSMATVMISVTDFAPWASSDSYTMTHNQVLTTYAAQPTFGVLNNDSDMDGDTLTIIGHTNPMHGTLTLNADGSFTYTPATGYIGNDSFTYTISDGVMTATAMVTITIN